MVATFAEDGLDAIFLLEVLEFLDEFDGEPVLLREMFGVGANFLAQRFGKLLGIIEQPDALPAQIAGHPVGMTPTGNRAGDDDAVETGKDANQLCGIPCEQRRHGSSSVRRR